MASGDPIRRSARHPSGQSRHWRTRASRGFTAASSRTERSASRHTGDAPGLLAARMPLIPLRASRASCRQRVATRASSRGSTVRAKSPSVMTRPIVDVPGCSRKAARTRHRPGSSMRAHCASAQCSMERPCGGRRATPDQKLAWNGRCAGSGVPTGSPWSSRTLSQRRCQPSLPREHLRSRPVRFSRVTGWTARPGTWLGVAASEVPGGADHRLCRAVGFRWKLCKENGARRRMWMMGAIAW